MPSPPADRFLRPHPHESADQRDGPLQHPLLLLHAGGGREVRPARRDSEHSRRSSGFARIAVGLGIDKLRVTGGEPLVRQGSAGADRAPGRHSGHPRPGADH